MIQENEVVMFLLGGLMLYLSHRFRNNLKSLPYSFFFMGSYHLFFAAWTFTIVEGFILPDIFNLLEHSCYAVGALLLAIWSFKAVKIQMSA